MNVEVVVTALFRMDIPYKTAVLYNVYSLKLSIKELKHGKTQFTEEE